MNKVEKSPSIDVDIESLKNSNDTLIYDIEANGLVEDSTEIWCISAKPFREDIRFRFWNRGPLLKGPNDFELNRENLIDIFSRYKKFVCHNQIFYDLKMLKKFFDIDLRDYGYIIDTFVISQLLNPDRELPKGCPTSIKPPRELIKQGFKTKKIGPHGLEAWGYRVGVKKIEIHDWTNFHPSIIERCDIDVEINEAAYELMIKEGNLCL